MSQFSRLLFSGRSLGPLWTDLGWAVARVFFGAAMALAHGLPKMPPSGGFVDRVGDLGFPAPLFFAWLVALGETIGGTLVALGLATRFGALWVALIMAVAAFHAHGADSFGGKEMALAYLCAMVPFILGGAGRFSLDHLLRRA
ncbi:MAG: DoxX family protein [Opitutales bacterium]